MKMTLEVCEMACPSIFPTSTPKEKIQRLLTNNTEYYSGIIVLLGHATPGQGNKSDQLPSFFRTV